MPLQGGIPIASDGEVVGAIGVSGASSADEDQRARALIGAARGRRGEIRAEAIEGGIAHELADGDVLAIPSGVPHQFVDVSDPFLYFVVKVEA